MGIEEAKKEILEIVKDKDDFKVVIEIKDNAKGEPQITVKVRDDNANQARLEAINQYKLAQKELKE